MKSSNNLNIICEIENLCVAKNLKLTDKRKLVLEIMLNAKRAMSAYDLLDLLKQKDAKAKPPTIYRALDFFIEHGFIHKIESTNSYIICTHLKCKNHISILFICDNCKNTLESHDSTINSTLNSLALKHRFNSKQSIIEVHGICENCTIH